ncbi:diguanylate cyclase/phosphodiesterase with PAS/PAC sensor(s) [Vibrio sinaloensis DSM 21326]|uniref:Diguanylate cyclase/phosphodiesterase with PAS/PAC sensor(S) n=1 Tax=Vibrio sinaloensis DSM 21326 TaxID=945550 RepID=E8M6H4_PHOS4|nr:bifunctional diguanylate cyclase/phosphodiesterase [Vibrio sinaloensis]EGA70292.1 diguanylate cyclase/phosphodiesterase with PAS/PAC sensor(s) [Vibrio sinaloensis DSM 21326]
MKNFSDQIEAMHIAYIIIDERLEVLELSSQAAELFRLSKQRHLSQADVTYIDENFSELPFIDFVQQAVTAKQDTKFELGINYPDRNVEWLKASMIQYKGYFILYFIEQSELIAARRLNRQLSMQDPHTGLLYREAFLSRLNKEYKLGTVCCVRICNYQRINDIWGAAVANLVFMEILARVSNELDQVICSKHSTDSFNVFIPPSTEFDVERFYCVLNEPFHFNGRQFFSNVALGYYCEKEGDEHEQSLNKAEMAILDVLSERVRLAEFQEELAKQIEHQNNLETEFRAAVSNGELADFYVVFQPVHDSETEQVCGAECLIRWTLKGNFVSPVEFIPIAERIGDIGILTQFNVVQLGKLVAELEQQGVDTLELLFALNISVVEILDVEFVDKLTALIAENQLYPSQIKLELTESALIDNFNYVNQVLQQLQQLGFRVSIDDFGTGFSSLSYLCRLSFDEIKIDRAFVTNVVEDSKLQTVFNSIASLATNMNKPVVAEGVETLEQLIYAKAKQVEYIQGYYFSQPLKHEDFVSYLLARH